MKDFFKDSQKNYISVVCVIFGYDNDEIDALVMDHIMPELLNKYSLTGKFVKGRSYNSGIA